MKGSISFSKPGGQQGSPFGANSVGENVIEVAKVEDAWVVTPDASMVGVVVEEEDSVGEGLEVL